MARALESLALAEVLLSGILSVARAANTVTEKATARWRQGQGGQAAGCWVNIVAGAKRSRNRFRLNRFSCASAQQLSGYASEFASAD